MAELQVVAQTTEQFADKFFQIVVNDNSGNLIISPLSVQMLLAMAAYGAGGKTVTQMRSALLIPSDIGIGQSGYYALIQFLKAIKGVELCLANKIYVASEFEVKREFKELTTNKFLSSSQEVDFNNPSAAAATINSWCEEQTNQLVKDVITPADVGPDTKLVLVNAVYFKGNWAEKFDVSMTEDKPFHIDEKTTKSIPTMFIRKKFRLKDLPTLNAKVIELPYQTEELCMIVILPNVVNGLQTVLENLQEVDLSQVFNQSRLREVRLHFPKFKIECSLNLKDTLLKLELGDMFENCADFSGIADNPLKISQVIQKVVIEVNEEGAEVVPVSRVGFMLCSYIPPKEFNANRPFYYQIRSTTENMPIFAGVYLGQE